jgi:hypothetical protein
MGFSLDSELFDKIESLDLDCIKVRLMRPDRSEGWSRERVDLVEKHYKRFLYMCVTDPDSPTIHTDDIDDFWHAHILDTEKYALDCEKTLGRFVHHFPYFGMRNEQDQKVLQTSFSDTRRKYDELFGESLDSGPADCTNSSCGAGSCGMRSYIDLEQISVGCGGNDTIDATGRPKLLAS